jgi:hypothetical protein
MWLTCCHKKGQMARPWTHEALHVPRYRRIITMTCGGTRSNLTAKFDRDCSLQSSIRTFCIYWVSSPYQIWLRDENDRHGEAFKTWHFARGEVELQRWKPRVELDILWRRVGLTNLTLPYRCDVMPYLEFTIFTYGLTRTPKKRLIVTSQ